MKKRYDEIYDYLKEEIETGRIKKGDLIPSEKILTTKFDCSRNTARRAIKELEMEGYVIPIKGRGVRCMYENKSMYTDDAFMSFEEEQNQKGKKTKTKVHKFEEIKLTEAEIEKTKFDDQNAYYIERIRMAGNEVVSYDINYFSFKTAPFINIELAKGSLYKYFERSGFKIKYAEREIAFEKANTNDKEVLGTQIENIAVIKNYVYNNTGDIFEYTESRYNAENFKFTTVSMRNNR